MSYFEDFITHIGSIQFIYGIIAVCGGIARYLNMYVNGSKPFNLGVLLASTFVSGFSGWMFAIMGISLNMPQAIIFIMAGTGGFFGEQTMKLVLEYIQGKSSLKP